MGISNASRRRTTPPLVRTTIALPGDLIAGVDSEVREGNAVSRNDFIREAVAQELWRREQAAIDEAIWQAVTDPEYIAEAEQIMKEFESADSETARMIDEEYGPYDFGPNGP